VIYGPQALATPSGGWPRALAEVAAVFVLQLVFYQLAEEIGFTGFLQHHWQNRYDPMKLTLYVALLWAVWHIPDHFAVEGWGTPTKRPRHPHKHRPDWRAAVAGVLLALKQARGWHFG
jgi:membrane protease YdiL (CAAX protease family)